MDALTFAGAFVGGFLICAILAAGVLKVLIDLHREDRDMHVSEREQWRSERRELLNRVQHPNLVPVSSERPAPRPRDPRVSEHLREMASVGRVVPGTPNGEDPDLP